jgi:hypothetical protein
VRACDEQRCFLLSCPSVRFHARVGAGTEDASPGINGNDLGLPPVCQDKPRNPAVMRRVTRRECEPAVQGCCGNQKVGVAGRVPATTCKGPEILRTLKDQFGERQNERVPTEDIEFC